MGEDDDHRELEEGEVVVGFVVAAGGDAAFGFQPGVGTFDGPALTGERVWGFRLALAAAPDLAPGRAGWEWVAGAAAFADPGFDLAGAQGVFGEPGVDVPRVVGELAEELRTMAEWLGLESVAVGERGDLARPLAAVLR